jgi:hypothetical protein
MTERDMADTFWLYGRPEDFVKNADGDDAQIWEWREVIQPLVWDEVAKKFVSAPMLERVGAFLQRDELIKPSLLKIIGRLLAGEHFYVHPAGWPRPEQYDDEGRIIWNTGTPTRATVEMYTYRLLEGQVHQVKFENGVVVNKRGPLLDPNRTARILSATKQVRDAIAKGEKSGKKVKITIEKKQAAQQYDVLASEIEKQLSKT